MIALVMLGIVVVLGLIGCIIEACEKRRPPPPSASEIAEAYCAGGNEAVDELIEQYSKQSAKR